MKYVCLRTHEAGGAESPYVCHVNQLKGESRQYGSFFDHIDDANDLRDKMRRKFPKEKFETFTLLPRK